MFFVISTAICTKKKKPGNSTVKSSNKSSRTSKAETQKPLSQSASDTNLNRTGTPLAAVNSTTSVTPVTKRQKKSVAANKYGKANVTLTAEDEFKFPSLKESVRSELTDLDELDDEPNPLMDKEVQERLRNKWAKKDGKDKTMAVQATQYEEPATKGNKRRSANNKTKKSDQGVGFLPTVPQAQCPSVYIK